MDGADVITAIGVGVSFVTSVIALVIAARNERQRERERAEDRAAAEAAAAGPALASLEAFAINYGAPAKQELSSGNFR